ncbi:MAG: flagellar filament capping protein FliD [Lachnospiraceae bacterium]|nr:flagellar filament capping protein FliD [Lachnospiraceae bacterium]
MPIRLSGLNSGLDTEAIVSALVTSYSEKKKKYEKSQQKLAWTQDAWKSVNTSVHDLYSKASSLRFTSAYTMKKTNVSDATKATVKAGSSTPNGTQVLKVTDLAQAGYLTGGKLSGSVKGDTKLSDLGLADSGKINITQGGKTKEISVDGDTTVNSFIGKLKDAGLSANFDEKNQRIYISAKESGKDNDFSITAGDSNGLTALSKLGLIAGNDTATQEAYGALKTLGETYTSADQIKDVLTAVRAKAAAQDEVSALDSQISAAKAYKTVLDSERAITAAGVDLEEFKSSIESGDDEKAKELADQAGIDLDAYKSAREEWVKYSSDTNGTLSQAQDIMAHAADLDSYIGSEDGAVADSLYAKRTEEQNKINTAEATISGASDLLKYAGTITSATTDEDIAKAADSIMARINTATSALSAAASSSASKVTGQDARIYLNDVEYTSSSNSFTVNGLSITALSKTGTKDDDGITITTSNDVQGLYDKVKDFLSQYNEVINDIYAQYNASSARGYEPLSDEEKATMSDKQVEKWEEKIKASLLRRDTTLGGIINTMTGAMSASYEINGQKYSLASFGIKTLGYFASSKNENYAYHIDGDEDDSAVSGNSDKLMAAITSDPDSVIEFMKQLTDGLYKGLDQKMKSTTMRSAYTIYNDKEMASEYSDYTSLIKKWDDRLKSMEDSYFKKFSKMESALSTLQQSTSALTGMLGR